MLLAVLRVLLAVLLAVLPAVLLVLLAVLLYSRLLTEIAEPASGVVRRAGLCSRPRPKSLTWPRISPSKHPGLAL